MLPSSPRRPGATDDTANRTRRTSPTRRGFVDTAGNIGTTTSQASPSTRVRRRRRWRFNRDCHRHRACGTNNDFITSDTTLVVSGTNGALAAARRFRSAATAAPAGTMLPSSPRRPGATRHRQPRTRRTSPTRRGLLTPPAISAPHQPGHHHRHGCAAETLAINAIGHRHRAWRHHNDFITATHAGRVGTNGGWLRARRFRSGSDGGASWHDVTQLTRRPGATTTPPARTRRLQPTRRGLLTPPAYRHHHQPGHHIDIDIAPVVDQ